MKLPSWSSRPRWSNPGREDLGMGGQGQGAQVAMETGQT